MSPFKLSIHHFFGLPVLRLPENSRLSDLFDYPIANMKLRATLTRSFEVWPSR